MVRAKSWAHRSAQAVRYGRKDVCGIGVKASDTCDGIALTIDIYLVLLFLSYISTYLKKHIQPLA